MTAVVIGLCASFSAHADLLPQLRVLHKDGHSTLIDLKSNADGFSNTTMSITKDSVIFKVHDGTYTQVEYWYDPVPNRVLYEIPISDIKSIENYDGTSGMGEISTINDNVVISPVNATTLHISGTDVKSAGDIDVFDMTGRRHEISISDSGDGYIVSLNNLASGIYIINVSQTSVKVIKR